jgi:glutaconyl-CoA/methylmalonyl-CoA decarboxylase subunit delta
MSDLEFGVRITLLGMGLVFGMLILLWGILELALRFEHRGETKTEVGAESRAPSTGPVGPGEAVRGGPVVRIAGDGSPEPALVAAITVAVLRHAEARRLQAAPAMRSYWPGSLLFASRWVAAGRTRQGQSWRRRR